MRLWFGVFVLLAGLGATMAADTIPATGGNIELTPMTHAHVQIEYGGKVIHIDPTMQSNLAAAKPADIIIITDVHGDHMDAKAIDQIDKPTTIFVAPNALAGKFPGKTEILKNGETRTIDGVSIQAIAAYNMQRGPKPGAFFHEKGRANAYVLTLGGKRVFLSGDTECVPEIKALTKIDVAFLTMNLPYTMPPEEAAACAQAFKPAIVYAYHYRGMDGPTPEQNLQAFRAAMKGTAGVEVRTPNFYPAAPAGRGGE
jgi:L-ascorbate metabolism protein UlaG (beta-lactamase superfamily)